MTFFPVQPPYEIFSDLDGNPLEDGYVYIGEANQNPITNPITVTFDSNGLYPAAQPIRTIGGYPSRNGSPSNIFVLSGPLEDYSILVKDKKLRTVYYIESAAAISGVKDNQLDKISDLRLIEGFGITIYVRGHTTAGDGGGGHFDYLDSGVAGTYTDDNGTIIVTTGGDGSAAWIRQIKDGYVDIRNYGAIGDGVTDNAVALQNALDSNFNLEIPPGNFITTAKLTASVGTNTLRIRGLKNNLVSNNPSKITYTGSDELLAINSSTAACGCQIDGVYFDTTDSSADGLVFRDIRDVKVKDCQFNNFNYGIYCTDLGSVETHVVTALFEDNTFTNCARAVSVFNVAGSQSNQYRIIKNYFYGNVFGYYSDATVQYKVTFSENTFEANTDSDIYGYNLRNCSIHDNYFEYSGAAKDQFIELGNNDPGNIQTQALTILNNRFSGQCNVAVINLIRPYGFKCKSNFISDTSLNFVKTTGSVDRLEIELPEHDLSTGAFPPVTNFVDIGGTTYSTSYTRLYLIGGNYELRPFNNTLYIPGINFGGDTLNVFTKGNFTPVAEGMTTAGVGTYSVQNGYYQQVGDFVFIQIHIIWSAHTGTGNLRIIGMPIDAADYSALSIVVRGLTFANQVAAAIWPGPNIRLIQLVTGVDFGSVQVDSLINGLWISGIYKAA